MHKKQILFLRILFFLVLLWLFWFFLLQDETLERFFDLKSWQSQRPWFFLLAAISFSIGITAKTIRFYLISQSEKYKQRKKKQRSRKKIAANSSSTPYTVVGENIESTNQQGKGRKEKAEEALDQRLKRKRLLLILMFSYCISYFLLSSGIFVKAAALKKEHQQKLLTTLSQVVLEKVFSLFLIVPFFFSFSYFLLGFEIQDFQYFNLLVILFITLCILMFLLGIRRSIFLLILRVLSRFPSKFRWRMKKMLVQIYKSFTLIENPWHILIAVFLTFCVWVGESGLFYSVFQAMGFPFSFYESVFAFLIVFLGVNLFPIAVVGIGVFEASMLLFEKIIGYESSLFIVAVQIHSLQILLYAAVLVLLMLLLKMDFFSLLALIKNAYQKNKK